MEVTTVTTDPEADPAAEVSADRTLGRLEAEADHLADQVDQVADQVDQVADQVDQVADQVNRSTEVAWDARAEVEKLREEMDAKFSQVMDLLQSADEDDQESSDTDLIELPEPEQAEPMPEVVKSRFWDLMI